MWSKKMDEKNPNRMRREIKAWLINGKEIFRFRCSTFLA